MQSIDNMNLNIAYIGGGSRAWARVFMTDLALERELGGEIRLYDIDIQAARDNEVIGNRISAMENAVGKWKYKAVPTLEYALSDADFVIISILPGTFTEMHSDVHLPERHGIFQSVGDTTGPGGIIRALRTVPLFDGFARAIKNTCPDAWVINYTNPMSVCVRALYNAFPQIKAFGCCHEVFGTQELLASMVSMKLDIESVHRNDININVLGINHFTWFDKVSWNNHDLMGLFRCFANEYYESGFEIDSNEIPHKCFTCNNRVKFDLFKKYGLIAAAGDRHLAEFIPGNIYLNDKKTAESWGFYLTSVDWRINDLKRKLDISKRLVSGKEAITLKRSGEEGILLIKAICGLERVISNVNLPNSSHQISNFPASTIVETNAVFSYNDVRPMHAGSIPRNLLSLMKPHIVNQELTLQASLDFDKKNVYRAFESDPLIDGKCTPRELQILADEMINNTMKYLPKEWEKWS
jgi:alpha-galactosidase